MSDETERLLNAVADAAATSAAFIAPGERALQQAKDALLAHIRAKDERIADLESLKPSSKLIHELHVMMTQRIAALKAEVERLRVANDVYIRRISDALRLLPPPDIEVEGMVLHYIGPSGTLEQIRAVLTAEQYPGAARKP